MPLRTSAFADRSARATAAVRTFASGALCLSLIAPRSARAASNGSNPDPQEPAPSVRRICQPNQGGGVESEEDCQLLAFPFLLSPAIVGSHVGVRVGASLDSAAWHPFTAIDGDYQRATTFGGIDVSKELLPGNLALLGGISGSIGTGVNGGTLIGGGAETGGGVDVGIIVGTPLAGVWRIAWSIRAIQRNGESFVVDRAVGGINQDPSNQDLVNGAKILGDAAGRITVPYRQVGLRFDAAAVGAVSAHWSLHGEFGFEHEHRYYRSANISEAFDIDEMIAPRLGIGIGYDFGWMRCPGGRHCFPLALLLEYQASAAWVRVETVEQALSSDNVESPRRRVVEHALALGFHYSSPSDPKLDVALTPFIRFHVAPELDSAAGAGPAVPPLTEYGGQTMARYFW